MKSRYVILSAIGMLSVEVQAATKTPNVIIILTDDQGYQDLGCYGSPDIRTPNIDRLASEGIRFTDFYVSASISSPSRASLLSGQLNTNNGVIKVLRPNQKGMPTETETIAEVLNKRGYVTSCIGKWHVGTGNGECPWEQGFDYYYGVTDSNSMTLDPNFEFADNVVFREGYTLSEVQRIKQLPIAKMPKEKVALLEMDKIIEYPCDQPTLTRRYFDKALEQIERSGDEPFFTYITPAMPHTPLSASEQFRGKSERGIYGDAVEEIDWNVGRLMECLKNKGIDENTIVIFSSDNGPFASKDGGCALPLRGHKFELYEGGVRVPFIVRWSENIPAGITSDAMVASIDLLPTISTFAGAKSSENIDGVDLSELFLEPTNDKNRARNSYQYISYGVLRGVRDGDWKYLPVGGDNYGFNGPIPEVAPAMLFNLRSDLTEATNLRNTPQAEEIIKILRTKYPQLIEENF